MVDNEPDYDNEPEDDFQDRIQRALNESKRQELQEKYGMDLESYHADLPPEVEEEWLDYIAEFERQFEYAEQIPVREIIGDPPITPLAEIDVEDVEAALDAVLDLLASHGIAVDFLYDDTDEIEAYRFITEELLDEEMDDICIPGMVHHFIYEEFHPNDREDAKMWAEEFLHALFAKEDEMRMVSIGEDELYDSDGSAISLAQFKQNIEDFYSRYSVIMAFSLQPLDAQVDGDYATVDIDTTWESLDTALAQVVIHSGISKMRMKRSEYGGWDVIQANIVGWDNK